MKGNHDIFFGSLIEGHFDALLEQFATSKKIIITDENVFDLWMEDLLTEHSALFDAEIIQLPPGEENKVIEICHQVWQALSEYEVSRQDLIINFGGGVITDMGGFIASTYKRGISFVNIPTTLLAQVDASVGGKTGVDLGGYKNQIGVFADPIAVFVDTKYHNTLDPQELKLGYAEMLKHGLIQDENHWDRLISEIESISEGISIETIQHSVDIKKAIVIADPQEKGQRKLLNLGHTIGHGIEGTKLISGNPIPHGFGVAWGILVEAHIAKSIGLLSQRDFEEIDKVIRASYPKVNISTEDFEQVLSLLKNDKKNRGNELNFTLLKRIGEAVFDQQVPIERVEQSLHAVLG